MPRFTRTHWSPEQLRRLREAYDVSPFPSRATRLSIATELQVTERNVRVWFQNARQRGPTRSAATISIVRTPAFPVEGHDACDAVMDEIRFLATSIEASEDAFDEEHVSSISTLVGADPGYVRCVMSVV